MWRRRQSSHNNRLRNLQLSRLQKKEHQRPGKPFPKWLQRVPPIISTHVLHVPSSTECFLNSGWFSQQFGVILEVFSNSNYSLISRRQTANRNTESNQTKWTRQNETWKRSEVLSSFLRWWRCFSMHLSWQGGSMVETFLGLMLFPCLFFLSSLD